MSLQLPARGAPPANYGHSSDHASTAVTASSSRTRSSPLPLRSTPPRNNVVQSPSPFIASRGTSSGLSMITGTSSSARARTFGSAGQPSASLQRSASDGQVDIAQFDDVHHLEDMLRHTDAMLQNPTVCANVKGGKAGLEARSAAISARLEHLYSVQGIDRGLKDASLTEKTRSSPVKKEDPDALEELERLSLSGSRVPAFNGSPASRRNWKQEILDRANASNGRITTLSIEESLSLQAKESAKVQAERLAAAEREDEELRRMARSGSGKLRRAGAPGKSVSFQQGVPDGTRNDFDDDDYDWSSQGYYYNDEES